MTHPEKGKPEVKAKRKAAVKTVDSTETVNQLLKQVECLSLRLDEAEAKLKVIQKWGSWAGNEVKHGFGQARVGAALEQLSEKLKS